MPKFTVFAHPYVSQQGKVIHPSLQITASNNFKYYKPYPYFALSLSEKPITYKYDGSTELSANEDLVRAYRVTEFADATCFKPVKFTSRFGSLFCRAVEARLADNESFWISSLGTKFILSEINNKDQIYFSNLGEQGLIATIIPTNLSPFGGGWDQTPGAIPQTTSYLICDYKNLAELKGLEICLRNAIYKRSSYNFYTSPVLVPAWNCTEGVNHV